MQLAGKVAMISGGGVGLGAALARRFSEEGAAVSICGRRQKPLESVGVELADRGASLVARAADVRDAESVEAWFAATREALGPIDVFVNNASILGDREAIATYDSDVWREVLEVNLTGAFQCARAAIPYLKETRGALINVSSGVGDHGRPMWGAYCVSKNGLEALSEILAGELEEDRVRVNIVDPGGMRTAMRADAYPEEDPMTLPTPYEISDVFVYLASDRSAGVTGHRFRAREFEVAVR